MPARSCDIPFVVKASIIVVALSGWCRASFADAQSGRAATALLRVYHSTPVVLEGVREGEERVDYDVFRNTQINLVKSRFVIEAALRKEEVAEIPAIKSAEDSVAWLRGRLQVDFPAGGEIMRVRLTDGGLGDQELTKVLDAVVEAFITELVEGERVERAEMKHLLERQLERVTTSLNADRAAYFDLAEALGAADSPIGNLQAEMALERWRANRADRRELQERLAEEYLHYRLTYVDLGALEFRDPAKPEGDEPDDEDNGEPAEPREPGANNLVEVEVDDETRERLNRARARYQIINEVMRLRIQSLDQEAAEIVEELERLSKQNAELQQRREELERKAELVDAMAKKLALWDVQFAAGPRVQVIQEAQIETIDGNQ